MASDEISANYMSDVIPEIEAITGKPLTLWPATIPETITGELDFYEMKPDTFGSRSSPLTETEKAVWYSHFKLWQYITVNGLSGWIFEHDADIRNMQPWPTVRQRFNLAFAGDYANMTAYYIHHTAAEQLVFRATSLKILGQIDTFLYEYLARGTPHKINCHAMNYDVKQYKHHGTTIQH